MKAKVTKKQVKKVVPKKSAKNIYMVRSYAAGVFFGEIVKRKMDSGVLVVDMKNAPSGASMTNGYVNNTTLYMASEFFGRLNVRS